MKKKKLETPKEKQAELPAQKNNQHSYALFDNMLEGCQIISFDWRYVYVNDAVVRHGRQKKENLLGHTMMAVYPGIENTEMFAVLRECMENRVAQQIDNEFTYPDGTKGWFELRIQPFSEGILVLSSEVTERVRAEKQVIQLKRLYATLSQVNQIIVRVKNREELFQNICDVAVECGEFALVWIGLLDENSGDVRPTVAQGLDVSQWPFPIPNIYEGELKNGLVATAIRTSRVVTSEDIQTNPGTRNLHNLLGEYGYHSSAVVPFRLGSKTIGTLNLISREMNLFKAEEEVHLLDEMGLDISFALASMESEAERKRAEAKYHALVVQIPAIVYTDSAEQPEQTLYISPQLKEVAGYEPEEWIADNEFWLKIMHKDDRGHAFAEFTRANETGELFSVEYRVITSDGRTIWLQDEANLVCDEAGRPLYRQGIMFDITERKQAEEKLERQNQRLKILREIDVAILAADSVENIVEAALNHIRKLIGCRRAGMTLIDWDANEAEIFNVRTEGETSVTKGSRVPLQLFQAMPQAMSKPLANNQPALIDDMTGLSDLPPLLQTLSNEGFRSVCILPLFSQGSQIGTFNMLSEIPGFFDEEMISFGREVANQVAIALTQNHLLETLRESEEKYRTFFQNSIDAILLTTPDGGIQAANPAACKMLERTEDEICVLGRAGITDQTDPRLDILLEERARHGKAFGELTMLRGDGSPFPVEISSAIFRNREGKERTSMIIRDITGRKRMEEQLRTSEARYRNLVENMDDIVMEVDAQGNFCYISPNYVALTGYSIDEEIESSALKYVHPEDRAMLLEKMQQILVSGRQRIAYRIQNKDGEWRWAETSGNAYRAADGNLRIISVGRDVTERKQMEAALQSSEFRYRELFDNINSGVAVYEVVDGGRDFIFKDFNRAGERIDHDNRNNLIGKSVFEVRPGIEKFGLIDVFRKVWQTGQPAHHPTTLYSDDRLTGWYETYVYKISPNEIVSVFDNVTERKQAEEKIEEHLTRLAALREIDQAINSSFDLGISMNVLLSHTIRLLNADAATILQLSPEMNMLEYIAELGFRTRMVKNLHIRIGESYAGRVALERRLIQIQDLASAPNNAFVSNLVTEESFVSYYGTPLIVKGKIIGVLEVFSRAFIERDDNWFDFLNTLAGQAAIAMDNLTLFNDLQHSNLELLMAYDATIEGWSRAMDLRDEETEGHTKRVTELAMRLAEKMGVSSQDQAHLRRGALLHDIGKLGVPDHILLKPGKLTEDEWTLMRQHARYAYEMLMDISYLRPALDIPYCHHEKWDGSGYPRGLKGNQIPLAARIFAVADVWDALCSDRPYRSSWSAEQARTYIIEQSGKHFDPDVVEEFLNLIAEE